MRLAVSAALFAAMAATMALTYAAAPDPYIKDRFAPDCVEDSAGKIAKDVVAQ